MEMGKGMKTISLVALTLIGLGVVPSYAQPFLLCEGQYSGPPKNKCAVAGQAYTPCYTSDNWAAAACRRIGGSGAFHKIKVFRAHGDECGYTSWRIFCSE